jgi:hypothetical protein
MTTKEKAKAYDKAIEKIKYVMEHGVSPVLNKEDLQDIFPELQESEDERIRKAILSGMNFLSGIQGRETFGDIPIHKCITWLEKQSRQKPKWTEEDEIGSDATIELLEYFINYAPEFRRPTIRRSIDWLKSLKQRMEE